jgi:hypothetical protein
MNNITPPPAKAGDTSPDGRMTAINHKDLGIVWDASPAHKQQMDSNTLKTARSWLQTQPVENHPVLKAFINQTLTSPNRHLRYGSDIQNGPEVVRQRHIHQMITNHPDSKLMVHNPNSLSLYVNRHGRDKKISHFQFNLQNNVAKSETLCYNNEYGTYTDEFCNRFKYTIGDDGKLAESGMGRYLGKNEHGDDYYESRDYESDPSRIQSVLELLRYSRLFRSTGQSSDAGSDGSLQRSEPLLLADQLAKHFLGKGSLQRRNPFNPNSIPDTERKAVEAWTSGFAISPDKILAAPKEAIDRGVHKLHGRTSVRKNPATGEREFLLHRGMRPSQSADFQNGGAMRNTSWTPSYEAAKGFASDYLREEQDDTDWVKQYQTQYGRDLDLSKPHIHSAWIPESKILHIPNTIGQKGHGHSDDPTWDKDQKPSKTLRYREHEVIVTPHQMAIESNPEKHIKLPHTEGSLHERINSRATNKSEYFSNKLAPLAKMSRPVLRFPKLGVDPRSEQNVQQIETGKQAEMYGRKITAHAIPDTTKPNVGYKLDNWDNLVPHDLPPTKQSLQPQRNKEAKRLAGKFGSRVLGTNVQSTTSDTTRKPKSFQAALGGKLRSKYESFDDTHADRMQEHFTKKRDALRQHSQNLDNWWSSRPTRAAVHAANPDSATPEMDLINATNAHRKEKPKRPVVRAPSKKRIATNKLTPDQQALRGKTVDSTIEHEAAHGVFDQIEQKHGKQAMFKARKHILDAFDHDSYSTLSRFIISRNYNPKSESFPEEILTHARDILVNPTKRTDFMNKLPATMTPEQKQMVVSKIKKQWEEAYRRSQNLKPEDIVNKSEDLNKALSPDELKSQGYSFKILNPNKSRSSYLMRAYHNNKPVGHMMYSGRAFSVPDNENMADRSHKNGYHDVSNSNLGEAHRGKGIYQHMLNLGSEHVKSLGSKGLMSSGYQRSSSATRAWDKTATHSSVVTPKDVGVVSPDVMSPEWNQVFDPKKRKNADYFKSEPLMKPWASQAQAAWGHSEAGKEALGAEGVKHWDAATHGKHLPKRVKKDEPLMKPKSLKQKWYDKSLKEKKQVVQEKMRQGPALPPLKDSLKQAMDVFKKPAPKEEVKKEELAKMPVVFSGTKKKPFTTIQRMQNKEGQGPYVSGGDIPELEEHGDSNASWDVAERTPNPIDDEGFTSADQKRLGQVPTPKTPNVKFGFHKPEHAKNWFSPEETEALAQHGFTLQPVKAAKVWSSGKQAFFEAYKGKANKKPKI